MGGPPMSTWSTPICLRRRISFSVAFAPTPRQIFGTPGPSAGGQGPVADLAKVGARANAPVAWMKLLRGRLDFMGGSSRTGGAALRAGPALLPGGGREV